MKINDDIYYMLQQLILPGDWYRYDKWRRDANGVFYYEPDNYIDMIYKIHRTWTDGIGMPAGGIATLYNSYQYAENYPVPNTSLIIRGPWVQSGIIGSGLTITPGTYDGSTPRVPINLTGIVSFTAHEHGHYVYGGDHACYGKMSGAGAGFGVDELLSPWESIKLGYMTPRVIDYNNPPINNLYSLEDYSSRSSSGEGQVLKAPIAGSEYFLIANRTKVSSYDIVMWGDTCREDPYFNLGTQSYYGKGVYIYHTISGENWPPVMDQECADGLWNYSQLGYQYPDWSTTQLIPYFVKTEPVFFKNDFSNCDNPSNPGTNGLTWRDGKSVNKYFYPHCVTSYFGIGKKETPPGSGTVGTDRLYTNLEEVWTSREYLGDRWDAWNIDYNVIFSPYSSPSTCDWNHNSTGIFVYFESTYGNTSNLKIYRTGYGGYNETQILALTPPSRPMIHQEYSIVECSDGCAKPQIIWVNNKEPDMLNDGGFKSYRILRAYSNSILPVQYFTIGYYNDYTPYDTASFIDRVNPCINCNGEGSGEGGYYRYKVQAIDKYEMVSVYSDFVAANAGWQEPDNFINPNFPKVFALSQNYPNPFNPSTEIRYSIPSNGTVSLKVYNLLGEEIANLVGEYKERGEYSVTFDGSNFASGVYFYKLEIGAYATVKKMVLIK